MLGLLCHLRWQGMMLVAGSDIPRHSRTRPGRQCPLCSVLGEKKGYGQRPRRLVWPLAMRPMVKAEGGILHRSAETSDHPRRANAACAPVKPWQTPVRSRRRCLCGNRGANRRLPTPLCWHSRGSVNHGLTPGSHRLPALCEGLALSSRTVTPATDLQPGQEQGRDTPDTSAAPGSRPRQHAALLLLRSCFPGHHPRVGAAGLDVATQQSEFPRPHSPLLLMGQELHSAVTQP